MGGIQSFKTFSEIKTQEYAKKLKEEVTTKRQKISERVSEILKEMEVSSLEEMEQDQKKEFVKRLFTEDKADDIEDEINKMGEPKKLDTPSKEKEEDTKDVSEGNAFIYAAAKAKGEGKSEFEFQGKTYKVTLKKNPLTESEDKIKCTSKKGHKWERINDDEVECVNCGLRKSQHVSESKEEQIAMELYAKVAGPEGEYSEGELVKADSSKFDEIVKDAGHSGSKAKKVAKELEKIAKANESVEINEWIVRDMDANFDTDDDLEYVKKIAKKAGVKVDYDPEGNAPYAGSLTLSAKNPKAILKVAKVTGHDMDIEDGVYPLEESTQINESIVNENYEVIYSDGMSQMRKFRRESQAIDFMKKEIKSNKKLREIAVYKPGMHSTTQTELVVTFWGNGSYLDNVSKRDEKLAAKKLEESVKINESEDINSAEEFKSYAITVLKNAFADDYNDEKANDVIDGLIKKYKDDFGAMVGALQASLD